MPKPIYKLVISVVDLQAECLGQWLNRYECETMPYY